MLKLVVHGMCLMWTPIPVGDPPVRPVGPMAVHSKMPVRRTAAAVALTGMSAMSYGSYGFVAPQATVPSRCTDRLVFNWSLLKREERTKW